MTTRRDNRPLDLLALDLAPLHQHHAPLAYGLCGGLGLGLGLGSGLGSGLDIEF